MWLYLAPSQYFQPGPILLAAICSLWAQQETHKCHHNTLYWPGVSVIKQRFNLCSDYVFMIPEWWFTGIDRSWFIIFISYFCWREKVKEKKIQQQHLNRHSKKGGLVALCCNSAWRGSSSHRWWTNVLLRERCTRLGTCRAHQWASFCYKQFEKHPPTNTLVAWYLPSIHDAMHEWDACFLSYIFHFVFGRTLKLIVWSVSCWGLCMWYSIFDWSIWNKPTIRVSSGH